MVARITQPAINLREILTKLAQPPKPFLAPRKQYPADGVQTDFKLPIGFKAYAVDSAGLIRVEGELEEFTQKFDGFNWIVSFAQAPADGAIVGIWPMGV
ncbi:hypothetical protein [Sulfitobacter sp. EE-36]|uniref:hypothetical protein n=1 Tax=Sulfitobacter TaxID=60136 RepID=UPI0000668A2C|nr:hypothetical protein [Sulfitobacter sp. EE-36]EAP82570.1 hypothetical protein EE36_14163 [Sulfitobacter sp. EE-36]